MALLLSRLRTLSSSLTRAFSSSFSSPALFDAAASRRAADKTAMMNQLSSLDISPHIGSCMPISMMRIGTIIHNIEMNQGQGGKLVRSAGTHLPSGVDKLIDSKCRATIGVVSNSERKTKKLRKAGNSRWLGVRPTVRGVAMNPVDHPHGGGKGRVRVVVAGAGALFLLGESLLRVATRLGPSSVENKLVIIL